MADFSPERMRELADLTEATGIPPGHRGRTQTVAALRAFASVVSAWQEYERATDDAPGQARDNLVRALADALDAGRGE